MKRVLFDSIKDFIQVKRECIFCGNRPRPLLTNFAGLGRDSLPILNAPVRDNKIVFNVSNTTAAYSIEAEGRIDIRTNALVFEPSIYHIFPSPYAGTKRDSDEPEAESRAQEVFLSYKPYMQLYCSSKSCGREYTISSDVLTLTRILPMNGRTFAWTVNRLPIWMETFVIDNLWIQNDFGRNSTNIYSRSNPDAKAITVPLIDFESMSKTKLLNRIKTFVTFS